ncbi:hypothetical protein PROFUN_01126 [Planoprotostelium fungivorum]|uniref:ER membrane protein complex subunit 4 n=1 Tax=Planoprotostelium fungivorum TaxID=1890364 RepID=A0A2P6NCE8_9EUKA|nr:hypothetical protein PROFUN_01126 [Planoprotostelium fungivorum]
MAATNSQRKWEVRLPQVESVETSNFTIRHGAEESRVATRQNKTGNTELKYKKAWEQAKAPAGSIFMTMFMAWMSGSSVHIFSIMITIYSFINPVKAILSLNNVFSRFEDPSYSLLPHKLAFIAIHLVTIIIAVYKCSVLGLLPTTASDWSSMLPIKQADEFSAGFMSQ